MAKIIPASQSLQLISYLSTLFSNKEIKIPDNFRDQVNCVEQVLLSDTSGLVNSLLDFAISSGCVDFSVETSNQNLTKLLNKWLNNINSSLRGTIPVGVDNLAKEYYRERWKSSSFLLLRTTWEEQDGFILPSRLWFVNGRDIGIEDDSDAAIIGNQQYYLTLSKNRKIKLPKNKNEVIFVQKPFESWGTDFPTPYIIKRGIYYNLKFLNLMTEKGSNFVAKALEYLFLMKKGTEDLAKAGKSEFIYSESDLKKVKEDLQTLIDKYKSVGGVPTHVTNFDTEIEHLIPEYDKALASGLYAPIERRILAGLGFVEVVEGISTRRDAILNPKVFMSEVQSGINDYKSLLTDILMTIIEKNKDLHKKFTAEDYIQIRTSPMKQFLTEDAKQYLRSIYDRGLLSKRTLVELCGDVDFDAEIERRKIETQDNLDDTMYPPVVQNQEQNPNDPSGDLNSEPTNKNKPTPDKQGPEKKNFKNAGYFEKATLVSTEEITDKKHGEVTHQILEVMTSEGGSNNHQHLATVHLITKKDFPKLVLDIYGDTNLVEGHTHKITNKRETEIANKHNHLFVYELSKIYEEAPYKNIESLPPAVKDHLPSDLQSVFMRVFNDSYSRYKDETRAFKTAWAVIKKVARKGKDGKWKKIKKASEESFVTANITEVIEDFDTDTILERAMQLEKAKLLKKQSKAIDKFMENNVSEESDAAA